MAFYNPDPAMGQTLADLVRALELEGRPGLAQQLSITWLSYESSLVGQAADLGGAEFWSRPVQGASWAGDRPRYPASVVKAFYLVAAEAWLQADWLKESDELRRAMAAMIRDSSNDATSLVVDRLSGTTSGPELAPEAMAAWIGQRQLVNQWYGQLAWPEWLSSNVCQKTWGDGPFGRERDFYGAQLENRNRLSTDLTARLLQGIMASALVSPPACGRMRGLLERSLDRELRAADPENQVDGFLGAGLPQGARLWSKAGWMSQARHDAAYVEAPGHRPMLLVVFSEGEGCARDVQLLPELAARLTSTCRS
ncbi:serine hydrolase [Cyanobium sp. HWJ4-Hawea]|uniref:serine hydrolase n=1 Tax=Cyanobium sp. HWJ4-Hawea TaxID=2823713 RepID=UPI0020CEDFF0|nr:serine hydrolase [Cyanobium sp. HWJ4-Hawea]MCP9808268.1 serine hydrolase [Cyanobium sp. HWJ4-Hawea]